MSAAEELRRADRALKALRGEMTALVAARPELKEDRRWQAMCQQTRTLGGALSAAAREEEGSDDGR